MKLPLLLSALLLTLTAPLPADDLFVADGRKPNVKRTFLYKGVLRENVQLGKREGARVHIVFNRGGAIVALTDLPKEWQEAITRREEADRQKKAAEKGEIPLPGGGSAKPGKPGKPAEKE